MHDTPRWLVTAALFTLVALGGRAAGAQEPDYADVNAYILQAEMALQREDYLMAVQEYRKAAHLSDNPDIAKKATATAIAYGFDDEALLAAKRWFELDEADDARAYLAQLSLRTGDIRAAKRHFSVLIEKSKEPPGEKLLMLAGFISDEGDARDADKLLRALARPYDDSPEAHRAVASLALRSGDVEHALERLSRAIELDPDNLSARLMYARALLAHGEVDEAIDYTARLIGDDFDPDPNARIELAVLYMMADRTEDALSQVSQVMLEQPGRTDALRLMGIINFHNENLDAAWDDFHDLLASGDYSNDALYYLGQIAHYREETDRAIRFYSEVKTGQYALQSQQRAAGLMASEKDDLKGAIELLDQFAAESPAHAIDVLGAKAQLLAMEEERADALKYYDKIAKFRPDDERYVLARAELLLRMERLDDALDAYADAVKRWPKSALALNAYGYTLADRTDRFKEAEKLIRKALKYDPGRAAIIDSMGWVLFKLGRHEEALVELERAYTMMQDHEVAAHIVETLVALDRRDEALERLADAEALKPDSALLKDVRDRLFPDAP
ncbi:MAG TPA: tetratricopeptide repeat protein [Woeseiaceae bacterium]|jgi:tetratricopeptide (TPR) repeat protein|nr:tetratricopeptide repeat protein [Woeseiaceae bacterium]